MTAEDTRDHVMHSEWGEITGEQAARINDAKAAGGRIVAVGTTSLRLLESAADEAGIIRPWRDETDIFITPGYRFKAVDALMTNFHLPRSTLFMLVSAFAGTATMKRAYREAIERGYRFYSYGDACLLERQTDSPVVLLRGVNVGGNNKLPMKLFASALEGLGCECQNPYPERQRGLRRQDERRRHRCCDQGAPLASRRMSL